MMILKIFLFHLLCCLLSAVVIAFNLTFASYQSTEIGLYIIHSLFIIICYFLFGYKIITTNEILVLSRSLFRRFPQLGRQGFTKLYDCPSCQFIAAVVQCVVRMPRDFMEGNFMRLRKRIKRFP